MLQCHWWQSEKVTLCEGLLVSARRGVASYVQGMKQIKKGRHGKQGKRLNNKNSANAIGSREGRGIARQDNDNDQRCSVTFKGAKWLVNCGWNVKRSWVAWWACYKSSEFTKRLVYFPWICWFFQCGNAEIWLSPTKVIFSHEPVA